MKSRFLLIVVIYEVQLEDSITLKRLKNFQLVNPNFPDILVYDNSLVSKWKEIYLKSISHYKHDPENSGVGGAYNYALELGKELQKEWLILFDQDTAICDNYFEKLNLSLHQFPDEKLFCPTVRSNNLIVSPTFYFAKRPFCFSKSKVGLLNSRFFTIINSGVAIKVSVIKELGGYSPDLPLDFSDHFFFSKYKSKYRHFVVIDCEFSHSLSSHSNYGYEVVYKRFQKYCSSAITYSKKVHNYFPIIWLFIRTLKLTLQFSRHEFFKYLLFKK